MASKLPQFTVRTSDDVLYKVRYIAEYNGRSANKEVEQLIKKHISAFEKEHGEISVPGEI
ncbi:hypothetical protein M2150_001650 [Lachnospiraceae bacterium PM6-15]|uniref:Arc family DNA-binding protein n=1 Tax=Ohessyouella blattaphilus TaxID=2949333 RepID=UPI003E26322E